MKRIYLLSVCIMLAYHSSAVNSHTESNYSRRTNYNNVESLLTLNSVFNYKNPTLTAPSQLAAQAMSASSVTLTWFDNSDNETGFQIERVRNGENVRYLIATTPANAITFTDTGLTPGTVYYYRIRAINSTESSSYTGEVGVQTFYIQPPAVPDQISAQASSASTVIVTWQDKSNNETGFQIERSMSGGDGYGGSDYSLIVATAANVSTFTDTGLISGRVYYYRIRAINSAGNSVWNYSSGVLTLPTPPAQLAAQVLSTSSIKLTWVRNSNNDTGFQIERSMGGTSSYSMITTVSASVATFTDTGLASGTVYYYRLRAINSAGYSAYSPDLTATTPYVPPTAAPSQIVAEALSTSSVLVTWLDNSNNETGFQVERAMSGGNGYEGSTYTLITTTTANVTTFTDTGLIAGRIYYYQVRAINPAGNSPYATSSGAQTFFTPVSPSQLAAQAMSASSIKLTWMDLATNETAYQIERSAGGTSGYMLVATLPADAQTYTDIGLVSGTVYYYRIRAINSIGNSPYTSDINAQTFYIPLTPSQLMVQALSASSIKLNWIDNSINESGFQLERSISENGGYVLIGTTLADVTTYVDAAGLAPATVYYYRVRAINSTGNSAYTTAVSAQTFDIPPAAPDQIATLAISTSSVIVNWQDKSNNETGFQIERSMGGGAGYEGSDYSLIATAAADVTMFTDTGLISGRVYYYRVRAINPAGNSVWNFSSGAQTFFIPAPPMELTAYATSNSSITLNWTDNSYNETGFQVERSTDEGSGFALISTTAADAKSFVDEGLSTGTTYYYRVRSTNAVGSSAYTSVVSAKTFHPPVPPSGLTVQATSTSSITLNWTDNSDNEVSFQVERSLSSGTGYSLIHTASENVTTFTDSQVSAGTTYYYRVRAINAIGNSTYTNESFIKFLVGIDPGLISNVINDGAFQYRYDSRNRMIKKKVPGSSWVYMIYDKMNRLIMTQDGNQRNGKNEWTFTKYDALNRPVLTGIYTTSEVLDQQGMQQKVNDYYALVGSAGNTNEWFETYVGLTGTVHGYSNNSFPVVTDPGQYLTVTYYDNYDFRALYNSSEFNFRPNELPAEDSEEGQETAENLLVKGQVTGAKVRMLTSASWLKSVNYYDDKYRLIQAVAENLKGFEVTTNVYDFVGKVLRTKTSLFTGQPVQWKNFVGAETQGDVLQSTIAGTWGTGASSVQTLPANADGWVEVTVIQSSPAFQFGLSDQDENARTTTLDYALQVSNGALRAYENGVAVGTNGISQPGDVLRVERINGWIYYKRNGTVFHISERSKATPVYTSLVADVSFNGIGAKLAKGKVSNAFIVPSPGTAIPFTALQSFTKRFVYDHAGRLIDTWHRTNSGDEILLSRNEYNELGQLVDKKLHSTDGDTFKQSIDYRYNIRGWLTSINNAELTSTNNNNTNDDANDFFGVNLAYNEDLKTGNASSDPAQDLRQYNGNISAMKWSSNQGLGDIKASAYNFKYDPMNRLKDAIHKQSSVTDVWQAGQYDERGIVYDLNGNIRNLQRKGENGVTIDNLTYNYGTGTTLSNKLVYVADNTSNTVDKRKGFLDGNTGTNDYTYDANGNMLTDRNKGITSSIVYNHLNLPDQIVRNSGTLFYLYDAAGRKHAQLATFSLNDKKHTEYVGPWVFENDEPQFLQHEEGRVMLMQQELIVMNDADKASAFSPTPSITLTAETLNEEKYVKVAPVVGDILDKKGVMIGNPVSVSEGQKYKYRIKGYSNSGRYARLYVAGNGTDFIWPGGAIQAAPNNESWIESTFTIPQGVTQISLGVLFSGNVAATASDFAYINEIELHEIKASSPEYQYDIKDHLGNVRVTFTAKEDVDESLATMEDVNASGEDGKFLFYDEAVVVDHPLFDKTYDNTPGATHNATRLTGGNTNAVYGLARSLSVMPGDKINMEVWAKYLQLDPNSGNWNASIRDFLTKYTQGSTTGITDGGAAGSIGNGVFPYAGLLNRQEIDEQAPKAFITWLVFDRNFNPLIGESGYMQIGIEAKETGDDTPHQRLYRTEPLEIKQAGFVYIYLSNENETPVEVFFDDFKVEHVKSPVIQMQDYYPFGLTYNSYSRENSVKQDYLYNSKELQDELSLRWYDYGARMYMSDIGRWGVVDPLSGSMVNHSPYSYAFNNPMRFVDLFGLAPGDNNDLNERKKRQQEFVDGGGRQDIAVCPTCPKDKEYDKYRNSDTKFAYKEGVGVYNDLDITISASRDNSDESTNERLTSTIFSVGLVESNYALWESDYDHVKYPTNKGRVKTIYKPDGEYRSARAAQFAFYSKSIKRVGFGLSIANLSLSAYQMRQQVNNHQPIDPINAAQVSVGTIGLGASLLNYVGLGGRAMAPISATTGVFGMVLSIPSNWSSVYQGAYDLQYASTPYYPSDSEIFGGN